MGWDNYYLELCYQVAKTSKDPSTKVGCIIFDDNHRIISTGVNGMPHGYPDEEKVLANRELKQKTILHSEDNALLWAGRDAKGCTIVTTPFMPCSQCASKIVQAGIRRVLAPYYKGPRLKAWKESFLIAQDTFKKCNVELLLYTGSYWMCGYSENE